MAAWQQSANNKWCPWTESEIHCLLQIWQEDKIQADLASIKRNRLVYEEIASRMSEDGFTRSYSQIKSKLAALLNMYKSIKDEDSERGRNRGNWPFFNIIDEIVGSRDSSSAESVESELIIEDDSSENIPNYEVEITGIKSLATSSQSPNPRITDTPNSKLNGRKRKNAFGTEDWLEFETKRLEADHSHQLSILKVMEEAEERRQVKEQAHDLAMMGMFTEIIGKITESFRK